MTQADRFENVEPSNDELTAEELQKILDLQSSILSQAVISDDYVGLLDKLCLLAESFTPNAVATVMLYEPEKDGLYVVSAPSLDESAIAAFNGIRLGEGSCGNAVFHGIPMYVCNARQDARWENVIDLAVRFNIWACWSFPIRNEEGEAVGSFAISSFEERSPESFHRELLQVCTSVVEVILARRAHSEAREQWFGEQLRSEKTESLSLLAGGIAHDFNNLLGAILGNLGLVITKAAGDDQSKVLLEQAQLATQRARDLSQQLLTFSSGGELIRKTQDIKTVIRDSAGFGLQGSNVKLEFKCDSERVPYEFDGSQIGQAIQNLVINARQSMPEGGTVYVSLERLQADALPAVPEAQSDFLRICIRDTGTGIPSDLIDRIFDPYFSTRAEGTGLGLALTWSIVRRHGGHIDVSSEQGVGTEFSIYLPMTDFTLSDETPSPSEPRSIPRTGCALVVDDNDLMRTATASMMRYLGFEVFEAEGGTHALEIYRNAQDEGRRIDITIMDLTMPGDLDGVETTSMLLELDPGAVVIVASGYAEGQIMADHASYGFRGTVAKPFGLNDLETAISSALDAAGQAPAADT